VVGCGDTVTIRARKMEILLATLLVRAGQVVSLDQLIAEIWNHNPPRRATAALYVYISQLRKLLTRPGESESAIVTRPPGYLLPTGPDDLDLEILKRLVNQGRAAAREQRHAAAAESFGDALALWRGPVLSDLCDGPIITGFVTWLEEVRLECIEKMVEAKLALGFNHELVSFLHTQVAEHPLHEVFYRQLMQALYQCERRADALGVYGMARTVLQQELGLEPGRALRAMQRGILLADEAFDARAAV
jgi:SARP family transcriptional regulator, regulator of embCAB operon